MVAADMTLVCRDCGVEFIFTAGEQAFYAERGFVPSKRRPKCRASRRAERQASDPAARPGIAAPPRPGFPAICADRGRETNVPFEPRGDRPVYCRDCFALRQRAGH